MSDALADFILHGDDREVDLFWFRHGMGKRKLGGLVPHYTDPDIHPRLIEDQIEELGLWASYHNYLDLQVAPYCTDKIRAFRNYLQASNRQRILAAARAMGLEHA